MVKRLLIKLERKIIRWLLKKVLSKSNMNRWVDSLLCKLENLSNKTIIDNEISMHVRREWGIPRQKEKPSGSKSKGKRKSNDDKELYDDLL